MAEHDELRKTVEYGLKGAPELKADEKRIWLGEFRERVVLGIHLGEINKEETLGYVGEALKNPDAKRLILNNKISMEKQGSYMKLAKEANIEYKAISTEAREAMGIVVASDKPVDYQEVIPTIKEIPIKFRGRGSKRLCSKHMEELKEISPHFAKEFKPLSFLDRLLGTGCKACQGEKKDS